MVDDRKAREVLGYNHAHEVAETVRAIDDGCSVAVVYAAPSSSLAFRCSFKHIAAQCDEDERLPAARGSSEELRNQ